ncbi:MAG: zf-HC2 domain-containing protein [Elusimicrobia bacterium]|nr:zf-HC2 domain-containing protein [Elusimicrobiota bacterium]
MNDENQELLSAYLDGALPEAERKALEERLRASAELRRELDELRAVAQAVKELPKEPLPPGFLARFQARRARGEAPKADWVFLPPVARPVAFALSCAVVAFVLWDKATSPADEALMHPPGAASIVDSKSAPVSQLDFASRVSGGSGEGSGGNAAETKALDIVGAASEPVRRGDTPPLLAENAPAAAPAPGAASAVRGAAMEAKKDERPARPAARARAAGSPLGFDGGNAVVAERGASAMTEEERSARNEQMFGYIESEKKKLGIAKVMDKSSGGGVMQALANPPATPKIAAPTPSLLKKASQSMPAEIQAERAPAALGPGRLSPDAGLVFTDARSLASSWVLLGFPGEPPSVDFASGRLVLIKPSATKIVSVTPRPNSVDVAYRALSPEEEPDAAHDRVAPIPLEPRTVLIFDASPR